MNNVLVTGGLGFIGSHVISQLIDHGYDEIVIVDNLSNTNLNVLYSLQNLYPHNKFYFFEMDITNERDLINIFISFNITHVFHMAALKCVSDSISNPEEYYRVNVAGTLTLLRVMEKYSCHNFIFSSSCTVYGAAPMPVTETSQVGVGISNPYGQTKYMVENIVRDITNKPNSKLNAVILRYFNPIGAHPSGILGENPRGVPNNIFPYICKVATKQYKELTVFGNDYSTSDGTCIRDYIDINDLAHAHIQAMKINHSGLQIFNIGTGVGVSVMELIKTFEKVNNVEVPYTIGNRREGDLPIVYTHINYDTLSVLNWKPKNTIRNSCENAWKYYNNKK